MKILARYIHGSEDSTDLDVCYIIDRIPEIRECKLFCNDDPSENRNVAIVENGIISWCYKGLADEFNNALLATYQLHPQNYEMLIERSVPRDYPLKMLSVLRKTVMELRHTSLRKDARTALKSGYSDRLKMLQSTDFRQLAWTIPDNEQLEHKKSMAFQLGQAISLNDGVELYTKNDIADYIPMLKSFLHREICVMDGLEEVKEIFLDILTAKGFEDCGNQIVRISGYPDRYIELKGKEKDVKTE